MRRTIPYLQYELGNDENEATLHVIAHTTFNILTFRCFIIIIYTYMIQVNRASLSHSTFIACDCKRIPQQRYLLLVVLFSLFNVVSMIKLWKVDIKVLWSILTIRTVFHIVFVYVSFN